MAQSIAQGTDDPTDISYYPEENEVIVSDPQGNMFKSIHDDQFRVTNFGSQDASGQWQMDHIERNDPDNPNQPTYVQDKKGNETWYEYDQMGNTEKVINDAGNIATYDYNDKNNIVSSTEFHDPSTTVPATDYSYDMDGHRLVQVSNPENETVKIAYKNDHPSLVASIEDGRGFSTDFDYDDYGNLQSSTDAEDNITQYTNDYAGRRTQVIDAEGLETTYSYDNTDHLTDIENHAPDTGDLIRHIDRIFDANGNLDQVQWTNNKQEAVTNYAYDSQDRLKSVTSPEGYTESYTYTENNLVHTRTDANDNTATYTYDNSTRLRSITYPATDQEVLSITRDPNGNLQTVQNPTGKTKFEYNGLNKLATYTGPFGKTVTYHYNDAGQLLKLTYPGGKEVLYSYDDAGRMKTVTDWQGRTTTYTYDQAGNLKTIDRPNDTQATYTHDDASRLTGISDEKTDGTVICQYSYQLDGVGNHEQASLTQPLAAMPSPQEIDYSYDKGNRIQSAGNATYTHDQNGNRKTKSADGQSTSYAWNYANRLTQIDSPEGTIEFKYDGLNNRVTRVQSGETTRYVLDLSGEMSRVLAETDGSGEIEAYYVYGQGLLSRIDASSDETRYYHYNDRGDTVALTDESGNVTDAYAYGAYGCLLDEEGETSNPFKFVGRYGVMDESGSLYFMRARFYDGKIGRFMSKDPLGFDGGDWNLYGYVINSPIKNIDPLGLTPMYNTANSTPMVIEQKNENTDYNSNSHQLMSYNGNWETNCDYGLCYRLRQKSSDEITIRDCVSKFIYNIKSHPTISNLIQIIPPYTDPFYEVDKDTFIPMPIDIDEDNMTYL
jgi:RHS repeat-associated protein